MSRLLLLVVVIVLGSSIGSIVRRLPIRPLLRSVSAMLAGSLLSIPAGIIIMRMSLSTAGTAALGFGLSAEALLVLAVVCVIGIVVTFFWPGRARPFIPLREPGPPW